MIVTRTPLRISLAGGGTDYPAYYRYAPDGGAVIGFALDHYVYLTVRELPPFFEHKNRIVYSRIELTDTVDEIQHPAVRAVLRARPPRNGIEITHAADLPSRAGLGSSSAFVVGLLHAMAALDGAPISPVTLADCAINLEQSIETVGSQDQVFAAIGGLMRIDFTADGFRHRDLILTPQNHYALLDHLLLFYTGEARDASAVAATYDLTSPHLRRMRAMVDEAEAILTGGGVADLGPLLDEGWRRKCELAPGVATARADGAYAAARAAGATGGKLLGAGGGGFLLIFAPPAAHAAVREALRGLVEVPVGIDEGGSRVITGGDMR